ncbi:hypothetical protein ACVIRO_004707 [Rhizobium ruizarguesonis]
MATTLPSISPTCATISSSALPVRPTRPTPFLTCSPDVLISALISLAALAERWASSRTSWATTAKPLPVSPARAASTPAFNARRLVWKAISSMTLMMLVISREDCSIWPIAATALLTTTPDCSAPCLVMATRRPASSARRLESLTVVVISSSAAAVSSTEAACCSVRLEKESADAPISREPAAIALAFSPIVFIVSARSLIAVLKSWRNCSIEGTKGVSSVLVRSPSDN